MEEKLKEWTALQEQLRDQVILHDTEAWKMDLKELKLVAGMDISYPVDETEESQSRAVACVVIVSYPDLEKVYQASEKVSLEEPYIPGFLAFRESGPLLKLLEDLVKQRPELKPDVILVDGNGILHPRRYGCACHIGLKSGIPTVGVAKNIYKMESVEYDKHSGELRNVGDSILLKDGEQILGMALKTAKDAKNPVFVSVGHKISLETAKEVVLRCSKFRVPEPIRFADFHSREILRETKNVNNRTE